ncbi:M6 family metalloprotease domain-containing protein [Streptomyces bohaiensis]
MARPRKPGPTGPRRTSPLYRSAGVFLAALSVMTVTSMMRGPGEGPLVDEPCGLPRHPVHHSLGLDTWNAQYPRPDRDLSAVMLFLAFPDAEPRSAPQDIAADYFPATTEFFLRASYGTFRLDADIDDRWLTMPQESGAYAIQRDWEPDRRAAYLRDVTTVLEHRSDLGDYDIVYLVADPDAPGVDSDATKVVNFERPLTMGGGEVRRVVTLFEARPPDRNVLAHETGHVFDLPDLYNRPEGGRGDWDTHVGDWDVMGSQFGLAPEPFGWHKWKLGWLDSAHVDCVRDAGVSLHTLRPLAAPLDPADAGADTRMVVVRTSSDEALVLEARARVGNDVHACTEGVLLYRVRGDVASAQGPVEVLDGHPDTGACHGRSVQPELADAPLAAGEAYYAAEDGVRVEVGDRTAAGGWQVKVVRE